MGTSFETIIDRFLGKITDDMYLELTPEDTIRDAKQFLLDAIPYFEFPRFALYDYDEYAESEFEDTLKLIPSETLSEDYRPEDVWIGHSYFIMNGEEEVRDRLLFEIIPLLKEYIRDGILLEDAQETIDKLYNIAMN